MSKKNNNRSIGYQFENAINSAFGKDGKGGADKHSMRKNKQDTTSTVFSYKERSSLLKTGYQLSNFLKENYPEVSSIAEIEPHMVQGFMNMKANTNNDNSLDTIKSTLNKLDKVSTRRYKSKESSFMNNVKKPKTTCPNDIRKNVNTTASDWEKISAAMEGSRSKANDLIRLAKEQMFRVESLTNFKVSDFDFKHGLIAVVDDKGGRNRYVPMRNPELCRKICGVLGPDEWITKLKPGSINKQFTRLTEKAGISEKYKDAKTGIHSLRKGTSCEIARGYKDLGYDREEILSKISQELGHGTSRRDVLKKYLDKDTIEYISK